MARRARPDGDGLAAWRGFLRAHQALVAEFDRQLQDAHRLPLAWYDVLVQLAETDGEATMGEIAGRLLISPSTCTRVVERMLADGLVSRRVDEHDARVRHIALTAAGRARLRAAAVTHLAGIEQHFARFLAATDGEGVDAGQLARTFDAMVAAAPSRSPGRGDDRPAR